METNSIKNVVGQHVTGKNFYGRVEDLEKAWRLVNEDLKSLILADPRRVGKTSFAYKIKENAEKEKWICLFCDIRGCFTEKELYEHLKKELKKNRYYKNIDDNTNNKIKVTKIKILPDIKVSHVDGIHISGVGAELERQYENMSHNKNIYDLLNDLDHSKNTLIVLDELVTFLHNLTGEKKKNLENVKIFLKKLYAAIKTPDSKIRWILCSSLSIDRFLSDHKLENTMGEMNRFTIDALNDKEAEGLIKALANSYNLVFSDESIKYMLKKLGWNIPYFIQLLFHEILELEEKPVNISIEIIEEAYQEVLANANRQRYFLTWIKHIDEYSGNERKCAHIILEELSKQEEGSSKNTLTLLILNTLKGKGDFEKVLENMLEKLEQGGYIIANKKENKHLFRSPLLRDFWYNKFVKR